MSSSIFRHPEIPFKTKLQLILAIREHSSFSVCRNLSHVLSDPAVISGVLTSTKTGRSWKRSIHICITRRILNILYRDDARLVLKLVGGTTGDTCRVWASTKQLSIVSEEIPEGGRLHWIGEKQLHKVLLYFHGMIDLLYCVIELTSL